MLKIGRNEAHDTGIGGGAGGGRRGSCPPLADKGANGIKCPHFADLVE